MTDKDKNLRTRNRTKLGLPSRLGKNAKSEKNIDLCLDVKLYIYIICLFCVQDEFSIRSHTFADKATKVSIIFYLDFFLTELT